VANPLKTVRLNSSNMNIKFQNLLIVLAGLAGIHQAAAQGTAFSYQGQLQNNGSPANGFYDFQFSLSSASIGGSQVGNTVTNLDVGVTNGLFTTTLDFGAVFTGNPTWLAISVCSNGLNSYVDLTPLQALTPVPYTIFATTASNLSGTIPASQVSGTLGNSQLSNNSITVTAGAGLAGGGAVALGGTTTLSNTGVLSVTGNGDITAAVNGGAVTLGDTATSSDTANTVVKRDASGNFFAGTITANLAGNAVTAITAVSATTAVTFSGSLSGDVVGTQAATVVSQVGGVTAASVANAANAANAAASANTASTIVARDASGNFSAGTITANLAGNAATATTAANLIGNVSDAQLSDNVPLLNGTNAFTGTNNFAGVVIATNVNNILFGAVIGNAIGLTNLNASQLTSGTVPLAQLPGSVLTNDESDVNLDGLTTVSNLSVEATNFVNYLVVSNAPAFDGSAITNLNASQLASGIVPVAQLPIATASALGAVQPDGSSITISNGVISATVGGGGGLISTTYITNAMIDGTPLNVTYAHGLGTFPGFIHPILLCTADDAGSGMVAGQMTEFTSVFTYLNSVFASVSYDTTNIYIQATGRQADFGGYVIFTSGSQPTSWSDFAIVVGFHQ
jgi:hypothetical protein